MAASDGETMGAIAAGAVGGQSRGGGVIVDWTDGGVKAMLIDLHGCTFQIASSY